MSTSVITVARALRYLTVATVLRAELASGGVLAGQLLPSEAELAGAHAVSRVTIRKALGRLKSEGLVDSRQGFGWYATAAPLRQSLSELTTIEAQIVAAGRTSRRQILSFAFIPAPLRAARILGEADVLEFSRLNLADDHPFAVVTVWVPASLAADLSRRAVEQRPLYELLGIALGGATQTITAVGASPENAEQLHVRGGIAPVEVRADDEGPDRSVGTAQRRPFQPARHRVRRRPSCRRAAGTNRTASHSVSSQVQARMLTARETTSATVSSDAVDWSVISAFAESVSGIVSVGLNAVALVNDV